MKKIGIAALIFAAVFLVTAVVGGVLLATQITNLSPEDVNNLKNVLTEIIEEGSVSVNGVNLVFYENDYPYEDYVVAVELDCGEKMPETITVKAGEIADFEAIIRRSSDEQLVVNFDGESCYSEPVSIDTPSDDEAVIRFGDGSLFSHNSLEADVEIYLPASFSGTLVIENGVGSYELLTDIDKLVVNNFVGEMEVNGTIGAVAIDHCVGEIEINNTASFEADCTINNCIGKVAIVLPKDSRMDIEVFDSINAISVKGILQGEEGVKLTVTNNIGEVSVVGR